MEELEGRVNPSTFAFEQMAVSFAENAGSGSVTVVRSGDLSEATVDYFFTDGSASSPGDYNCQNEAAFGTLYFPADVSSLTIGFSLNDDSLIEGDEEFHLYLSNAINGDIEPVYGQVTVTIVDNDFNTPPVALNDGPYTVLHGQSTDPIALLISDADNESLTLTIVEWPTYGMLLVDWVNNIVAYTANSNYAGEDSFSYYVSDNSSASNTATVSFTVTNTAPVAVGGGPYSVFHGHTLADLPLQISDADNDPLSVTIVEWPSHGMLMVDSYTFMASYTPDSNYAGPDFFTFKVDDGIAESATVAVTFNLLAPPSFHWGGGSNTQAPILVTPSDQTNVEGESVSLQISASDPEGQPLTFTVLGLPGGLTIDGASGLISGTISYTAAEILAGEYQTTILVTDGEGGVAQASFLWTVTNTNRAASLEIVPEQSSQGGDVVNLPLVAVDPDGDELYYAAEGLPEGLFVEPTTGIITGTISTEALGGSYDVKLIITDGASITTQSLTWTVQTAATPSIVAPVDQVSTEGDLVNLQVTASDPEGGTLTYSAEGLPQGLTIDPLTGLISGAVAPGAAEAASWEGYVTVAVSNGARFALADFHWTVQPFVTLAAAVDQVTAEGDPVSLSLTASVPSGTITYAVDGLPDGLTVDPDTGVISGTVATGAAQQGQYWITVVAQSGAYETGHEFTWTVTRANNSAPTINSFSTLQATVGEEVVLTVTALDSDGDRLTYQASGLPDGLEIDPETGVISGTIADTAAQVGSCAATVTVEDSQGAVASESFAWTVNDAGLYLYGAPLSPTAGVELSYAVVATFTDNLPGRPVAWYEALIAWGDGSQSDGLIVESEETPGQFTVYGSHTYADPGWYLLTVGVTNPGGSTQMTSVEMSVAAAPLTLTGEMTVLAAVGQLATRDLAVLHDGNLLRQASGYLATVDWGDGTMETVGVEGATGLFLVRGGHSYAAAGDYSITITVTDDTERYASTSSYARVGDYLVGSQASLSVGVFVTAGSLGAVSASIDWGDGTVEAGNIVAAAVGFAVEGQHTYAQAGDYLVHLTVSRPGEETLSLQDSARVVAAPYTAAASTGEVVGSTNADDVVSYFASANLLDTGSEYTALVDWGDGAISAATQVVLQAPGLLAVRAAHSFLVEPVRQGMVQLFLAGQLVAVQPAQPRPDPENPLERLVLQIPANRRNLANVLLDNFNNWANAQNVLNQPHITFDRVNQLIGQGDVRWWDAVAVATLKVFVFQAQTDPLRSGEYIDVFGIPGGVRLDGLRRVDIERFRDALQENDHPLHARAMALNTIYQNRLEALRVSRSTPFPIIPPNLSPIEAANQVISTVRQGYVNDCSFLSALMGLIRGRGVNELRGRIRGFDPNALIPNVTVRFYENVNGQIRIRDIPIQPPTHAERVLYASTTDGTMWLSLFEKAYVTAWPRSPRDTFRRPRNLGLYDVVATGEWVDQAVLRVTGRRGFNVNLGDPQAVPDDSLHGHLNRINANPGWVLVVATKANLPPDLVAAGLTPRHAFAVVEYTKNRTLTLRNPQNNPGDWGSLIQNLTLDRLRELFDIFVVENVR